MAASRRIAVWHLWHAALCAATRSARHSAAAGRWTANCRHGDGDELPWPCAEARRERQTGSQRARKCKGARFELPWHRRQLRVTTERNDAEGTNTNSLQLSASKAMLKPNRASSNEQARCAHGSMHEPPGTCRHARTIGLHAMAPVQMHERMHGHDCMQWHPSRCMSACRLLAERTRAETQMHNMHAVSPKDATTNAHAHECKRKRTRPCA